MKRIKILFRKNLKMSESKLAAQCVHAALGLDQSSIENINALMSVVVLGISDKKFDEQKNAEGNRYLVRDAGYTEVAPGTETCLAFLEEDVR